MSRNELFCFLLISVRRTVRLHHLLRISMCPNVTYRLRLPNPEHDPFSLQWSFLITELYEVCQLLYETNLEDIECLRPEIFKNNLNLPSSRDVQPSMNELYGQDPRTFAQLDLNGLFNLYML
ncbi:hypothetical protein RvY_05909 [Ramazzottius varieornatus]|uniref:Uncharacterized protein n=1 Tax=Ramazzottius varieornatus TaxID=947166 RepID=A0A1D1V6B8_RAMVA|nr:hypothetical protein RvY_05909 [Ramazzottius varieornatus]